MDSAPVADTWEIPAAAIQPGGIVWVVDESQTLVRIRPEIIATLPESVIVKMNVPNNHARVVTHAIAGGEPGAKVLVLNAPESGR